LAKSAAKIEGAINLEFIVEISFVITKVGKKTNPE
jgi:hypothetical protein